MSIPGLKSQFLGRLTVVKLLFFAAADDTQLCGYKYLCIIFVTVLLEPLIHYHCLVHVDCRHNNMGFFRNKVWLLSEC